MTKLSNVPLLLTAFSASVTTGGFAYAFGVYGDALKKSLALTQTQLDTISATYFCAGLFSWIPGLVVDRYGTRISLILGGTTGAGWSLLYWAICRQWIPLGNSSSHAVPILSAIGVFLSVSCALIVGSMFKIAVVCSGPGTRGTAVGVAKGYVGLGSGIYASLFQAWRAPDESALDFLPLAAVFFVACVALPAALLLPSNNRAPLSLTHESVKYDVTDQHFRMLYLSLLAVAALIVQGSIAALLKEPGESAKEGRDLPRVGLLLLIWLGPIWSMLVLPRREQGVGVEADGAVVENTTDDEESDENNSGYHDIDDDDDQLETPLVPPPKASSRTSLLSDEENGVLSRACSHNNTLRANDGHEQQATGLARAPSPSLVEMSPSLAQEGGGGMPPLRVTSRTTLSTEYHHHYHSLDSDDDDSRKNERKPLRASGYQTFREVEATESSSTTPPTPPPSASLPPTAFTDAAQTTTTTASAVLTEPRHEHTLTQMLQTPSAWLMLWICAILVGSGTYKTNNMGEMVEALGFDQATVVPSTLALFSVAQAGARILTGVASESTLTWKRVQHSCGIAYGIPRPFYLVIASVLCCFVHLWLSVATSSPLAFVAACTMSGLCFGMAWPSMVLIVGDVFGLKHHAANYLFFDGSTKALGTIFLSDYLAGRVYEAHVDNSSPEEQDGLTCMGTDCFYTTHVVVAGLAVTCVVASLALQYISRHAYQPRQPPQHLHAR